MDFRESFQGDLYALLMNQILPDPLFVHDHDGRFVEVNDKACESLGYTRAELLTMRVFDFEQDFDVAAAQEAWSRMTAGSTAVAKLEEIAGRLAGTSQPGMPQPAAPPPTPLPQ